jgi:molecular chaperone Hsp33
MTDCTQPFEIEKSNVRGRMVRLGDELDLILTRHAYPKPVARFLAETLTLAVMLASTLKYEGVFSLQTRGDGPIRLMVADVTSTGDLRAYAQFDEDALAKVAGDIAIAPAPALLGKGHIAFTVDQGPDTERYQGIVELYGKTLADCVQHYFRQSEQIDTGITVPVDRDEDGHWRSGGVLLQRLPGERHPASDEEDGWRRAMVLLTTATTEELVDPALRPSELLMRLYHEDGVRVWPVQALRFGCRCSRERVTTMLGTMSRDDIEAMKVDGVVEVACQFCSTVYRFDDDDLAAIVTK